MAGVEVAAARADVAVQLVPGEGRDVEDLASDISRRVLRGRIVLILSGRRRRGEQQEKEKTLAHRPSVKGFAKRCHSPKAQYGCDLPATSAAAPTGCAPLALRLRRASV